MVKKSDERILCIMSLLIISGFILLWIIPDAKEILFVLSMKHPFLMAFGLFCFIVTSAEILKNKIADGVWQGQGDVAEKAIMWGCIGVILAIMIKLYAVGTDALLTSGYLPGGTARNIKVLWCSVLATVMCMPTILLIYGIVAEYKKLRNETSERKGLLRKRLGHWCFDKPSRIVFIGLYWTFAYSRVFMCKSEEQLLAVTAAFAVFIVLYGLGERLSFRKR